MHKSIIQVSEDFWNIRGSFRIGGVVDIGTQASLVRLANGNFLFLDSCRLDDRQAADLERLAAECGGDIEAILNLHPFHTVHVTSMHERFPRARLHGTSRHRQRFPDLPWETLCTEDPKLHKKYAGDFTFTIPDGVDFISSNDNIHFSSVLALHRSSGTLHVDDTLMYIVLPRVLRLVGVKDTLGFHPTLSMALQKRPGAAAEFRRWAEQLVEDCGEVRNLCAAHSAALLGRDNRGAPIQARVAKALQKCRIRLRAHERRYG